jgi:hypothetical protein
MGRLLVEKEADFTFWTATQTPMTGLFLGAPSGYDAPIDLRRLP